MKKVYLIAMLTALFAVSPVYAGWGSDDDCNGVANCSDIQNGDDYGNHSGPVTGNSGITNAHSSDENNNNLNSNNAEGGNGVGVGTGVGTGIGTGVAGADADADSNSAAGVFGSGNSHNRNSAEGGDAVAGSASGVFGSGNSSSDTDVDASSRNTNLVGSASSSEGGDVSRSGNSRSSSEGGDAFQGQAQGQGQQQGQLTNVQTGDNSTTSSTGDQSTTLTDNSFDNGNTVNIGGQGGPGGSTLSPTSDSSTTVGDTTLENSSDSSTTIGDTSLDNSTVVDGNNSTNSNSTTVNIGEDGPLTASSQAVDAQASVEEGAVQVDASDNSVTTYEAPEIPVPTASTAFSSVCTSGAAAQRPTYGINLAVTSDVCMHLMMADAWVAMGDMEKAMKSVEAAGRHAAVKGFMGHIRHIVTIGIL